MPIFKVVESGNIEDWVIAGILGAAEGWGWDYIWAILLFTWPYLIYIILIFFMGAGNLFRKSEE